MARTPNASTPYGRSPTRTVSTVLAGTGAIAGVGVGLWQAVHLLSPRVDRWAPGTGREVRVGRIGARVAGTGEHVVLFLSGIAASGTFWGSEYDCFANEHTVVFADPLGFGCSVVDDEDADGSGLRFTVADHVDALRMLLDGLSLSGRPLTIVGHSMGGSLAISLGAALAVPPVRVITIGAPLYTSRAEADERVAGMGWFEALLARGPSAELVCRWMCAHHAAARMIAVVANPTLPTPIARAGVVHTWASYSGSFASLVEGQSWEAAVRILVASAIPLVLVAGIHDPVPVPGRADEVAAGSESTTVASLPGGHDAPLSHPVDTVRLLERLLLGSA